MRSIRGTLAILFVALLTTPTAAEDKDKPDSTKSGDDVTGAVTLAGKPLPAGWITFHGKGGRSAAATIDEGKYALKGAPTGQVRVTIDTAGIASMADAL